MAPSDVVPLPNAQARKMFTDLADSPFIALCFVDSDLRVYTKGLDERALTFVRRMMHLLEEEVDGTQQ